MFAVVVSGYRYLCDVAPIVVIFGMMVHIAVPSLPDRIFSHGSFKITENAADRYDFYLQNSPMPYSISPQFLSPPAYSKHSCMYVLLHMFIVLLVLTWLLYIG